MSKEDPICGNCGKPYSEHYFEREVFCNSYTNGDTFQDEPHEQWVMEQMADRHPELFDAIVDEWKRENGHS